MERLRDTWKVTLLEQKRGSYDELVPIAKALGVPFAGGLMLSVKINQTPVMFLLEIDSGTVRGLKIFVTLEGPNLHTEGPFISLQRETPADVRDKRTGLSREVQLGVSEFDEAVYIDSDASDAEVKRVLSKESTRDALLWLLEGGVPRVTITARTIEMRQGADFETARLLMVLEALLIVARAGGPRGERTVRRGTGLVPLGFMTTLVSGLVLALAVHTFRAGLVLPTIAFVLTGTLMSIFTGPFVRGLVSGDSGSGARARLLGLLVWLTGGAIGANLLLGANALLGDGADVQRAEVLYVNSYDDEDQSYSTTVRWESGHQSRISLKQEPRIGARLTRTRRHGLFGAWGETIDFE